MPRWLSVRRQVMMRQRISSGRERRDRREWRDGVEMMELCWVEFVEVGGDRMREEVEPEEELRRWSSGRPWGGWEFMASAG